MQRVALAKRSFAEPGPRFSPSRVNRGPGSAAHRCASAARCAASGARDRLFHCRTADELSLLFDKSWGGAQTDCQRAERKFWHPTTPELVPRRERVTKQPGAATMSLDTSTLYLVATLVAALLGVMLLFFSRQERIAALNWWGAAYILGAASVSLWTLASTALGEMPSLALNAGGFIACGMVW